MNDEQKKEIEAIKSDLEALRERAQQIANDMQENIDSETDEWKDSEKGLEAIEKQEQIQSFTDAIDTALSDAPETT